LTSISGIKLQLLDYVAYRMLISVVGGTEKLQSAVVGGDELVMR
jgi:hypothetical protein